MTGRITIPDIPFRVTLADGSPALVHAGRTYELTYRTLSDARHDWEMRAVLRKIEQTLRHGPRFVFNGSPRFGDHGLYGDQIQAIIEAPGGTPDLHPVPRKPRAARAATYELCVDGEERSIMDALMGAIDAAASQDRITLITDSGGTRIAAIVPVSAVRPQETRTS